VVKSLTRGPRYLSANRATQKNPLGSLLDQVIRVVVQSRFVARERSVQNPAPPSTMTKFCLGGGPRFYQREV
jgi:hypothetical protein